ncbi:MAG: apolipoprotein N-acyltransferase [Planctomycetes bacterium]|nr:apolipoprotein N-acyltransferase [Planctomycetota bacterium]
MTASNIQNAFQILKAEGWALGFGFFSSILLYLSFFPADLGFLGWTSFVPILYVMRSTVQLRIKLLSASVCGLCFFFPALQWMRLADPMMYFTWIGLALYCNLFFVSALLLILKFNNLSLVFSFPLIWIAFEHFRSTFLGGFSWYLLAHSQHACPFIIQISDLFGAYCVSFLVASVNGFLTESFLNFKNKTLKAQAVYVLLLILFTLTYGALRISQGIGETGPVCASLQGNVEQNIRNEQLSAETATNPYLQLSDSSIAANPDLIIWPETSYSREWYSISPEMKPEKIPPDWNRITQIQKTLGEEVRKRWNTSVLLGLNSQELTPSGTKRYNSALLVSNDDNKISRYDKIHRVPFGEFIPFKDVFPWLKKFAPYDFEYSIVSGAGYPNIQFPMGPDKQKFVKFGTLICYEDTDPSIPLGFFNSGSGPNFFINISNDGWFKGSEEHEQHLAISRFRAIETRRAIIRSVNMGISALIDSNGKVLKPESTESTNQANTFTWKINYPGPKSKVLTTSEWHKFKSNQGVLIAAIPIDSRFSLYTKTGDLLPYACWLVLFFIFLFTPKKTPLIAQDI